MPGRAGRRVPWAEASPWTPHSSQGPGPLPWLSPAHCHRAIAIAVLSVETLTVGVQHANVLQSGRRHRLLERGTVRDQRDHAADRRQRRLLDLLLDGLMAGRPRGRLVVEQA